MERLVICSRAKECDTVDCRHKTRHYPSHVGSGLCPYNICWYSGKPSHCVDYPIVKEVEENESDSVRSGTQHEASDETVE